MGKSVFPKEVEGQEVGAYLLVTLDSNDQDQLDKLVEEAAEMLLEAGALDVPGGGYPMFLEKTWLPVPPSWKASKNSSACWTNVTWWFPFPESPISSCTSRKSRETSPSK